MAACRVSRGCRSAVTSRHDATRPRPPTPHARPRAGRSLRAGAAPRQGWHGRGVPRPRAAPRAPSRHQAAAPAEGRRPTRAPALSGGSADGGAALAPQHRSRLRRGRIARRGVLRDGVRRGADAGPTDPRPGNAPSGGRCAAVARGGTGAGACARARRRTPRRETRQHPARRGHRAGPGIRFRHRPGGRGRRLDGFGWGGGRDRRLHEPGAGERARRGRTERSLLVGGGGYHALSGRLPFDAPDGYAMLARHIAVPPPPLASVAPHVPRRLAQVVDRCLHKEPAARFPSGVHLAEAVGFAFAPPAGPPIALRAFLVEGRDLSPVALAYGAIVGLAVPLLAIQLLTAADLGPGIAAAGLIGWLLVLPVVMTLARVRRLRAAGFDRDDLTDALAVELGRRREELAFLYGEGPTRVERVARRLAYAGLAVAAAVVAIGLRAPEYAPISAQLAALSTAGAVALLAAVVARARTEHRTDPKGERRLRFWGGPLGRGLFRLRARGTPSPPPPPRPPP